MEVVFDIFNDYRSVASHKKANIANKNKEVIVKYNGGNQSAGFRTLLDTIKGYYYQINIEAKLEIGDMAFVYCESVNPSERLIERKYFVTDTINKLQLHFRSVSNKTYVGLLFFNSGNYKLSIRGFRIQASRYPFSDEKVDENEEIETDKYDNSLQDIIQKNNDIVHQMIINSYKDKSDSHTSNSHPHPHTYNDNQVFLIETSSDTDDNGHINLDPDQNVSSGLSPSSSPKSNKESDENIEKKYISFIKFVMYTLSKQRISVGDDGQLEYNAYIAGFEDKFDGYGDSSIQSVNHLGEQFYKWIVEQMTKYGDNINNIDSFLTYFDSLTEEQLNSLIKKAPRKYTKKAGPKQPVT